MKICFVISSLGTGGAERMISTMANSFSKRGHSVSIIKLDAPANKPFFHIHENIAIVSLDVHKASTSLLMAILSNLKRIQMIRKALDDKSPDTVISFMGSTNVITLLASLGAGRKTIVSDRNNPPKEERRFLWMTLQKLLYRLAHVVVVQTHSAKRDMQPVLKDKTTVIPNPVPLPPEVSSYPCSKKIVCTASLTPQKNLSTLFKAFSRTERPHPDWTLTIYGEGPLRKELEKLREELNQKDRINLPGNTTNIYEKLIEAELFVLPSQYEGFPNALCEAMAVGLPVIATDCPHGPSEIIQQGLTGILVPVGDQKALAEAMISLMQNSQKRQKMGISALRITSRFNEEDILDMWENLMQNQKMPEQK